MREPLSLPVHSLSAGAPRLGIAQRALRKSQGFWRCFGLRAVPRVGVPACPSALRMLLPFLKAILVIHALQESNDKSVVLGVEHVIVSRAVHSSKRWPRPPPSSTKHVVCLAGELRALIFEQVRKRLRSTLLEPLDADVLLAVSPAWSTTCD